MLLRLSINNEHWAKIIYPVVVFIIPAIFFIYIGMQIINPSLKINDPKTYFLKNNWDSLNIVITIFNGTILVIAIFIYNKLSDNFVKWYVGWKMKRYK